MAITVNRNTGLRIDTGITATTVTRYDLPSWTQSVLVTAPLTSGAAIEVAWSGTDADPASTADQYVYVPAGGGVSLALPPEQRNRATRSVYVRLASATSSTICVACSPVIS